MSGGARVTRRWAVAGFAVLAVLAIAFSLLVGRQSAPDASTGAPDVVATVETTQGARTESGQARVVVYGLDTCGHCARLMEWLGGRDDVEVTHHEVSDPASRAAFLADAERLGFDAHGVPVTIVGERVWIGFGDETRDDIGRAIDAVTRGGAR